MAVLKDKKGEKAKVETEEVATEAVETPKEPEKKEEAVKPSFFVYIGPSIRGYVQYGAIFTGTREDVEKKLSVQIAKYPRIKKLLVSDLTIVEDRINVNKPGTRLNSEYRKFVSELK
jgi:hypothetical protein